MSDSCHILTLPNDVGREILGHLHPKDVVSFARTCRSLYAHVFHDNDALWHTLFLNVFDEPSSIHKAVRRRFEPVSKIANYQNETIRRLKASPTDYDILADIVDSAEPDFTLPSKNADYIDNMYARGVNWRFLAQAVEDYSQAEADQARVRTFLSQRPKFRIQLTLRGKVHMPDLVYCRELFNEENEYGPFKRLTNGDLVTDWVLLSAISDVVFNNERSRLDGDASKLPIGPDFARRELIQPLSIKDWAGVEDSWHGTYSFIDYRVFHAYNVHAEEEETLQGQHQVLGDIASSHLKLDKKNPEPTAGCPYPRLTFRGVTDNPRPTTSRGSVELLADGQKRWTFIIRYGGADQWKLSGVEIGGCGIVGIWSAADDDEDSPCGPFWYWRHQK